MSKVILSGVVGSKSQGFATPSSDEDRGFVFLNPVQDILWGQISDHITTTNPDTWGMELQKFVNLAMKSNPTVIELLYLPTYETITPAGSQLVNIRDLFLSKNAVYYAHTGYARSQHGRSRDASKETSVKNRRHALRLLVQGIGALKLGTIIVNNPSYVGPILAASNDAEEFDELYGELLTEIEDAFGSSRLPNEPRVDKIQSVVAGIRKRQMVEECA